MNRMPFVAVAMLACLSWVAPAGTPAAEPNAERKGDETARHAREAGGEAARVRRLADSVVITNEVLENLYGPGAAWVPPEQPAGEGAAGDEESADVPVEARDPLEKLRDRQARERTLRELAQRERGRVAELETRIRELESRLLAVRNPYLPRPQVPEELREEWDELDGVGRVDLTQKQIEDAREQLDEARKRLALLEAGQAPE